MGYKRKAKVYKLSFQDEEYDGLIVRIERPILRDYYGLFSRDSEIPFVERETAIVEIVVKYLVEWNLLDDDDVPVPITLEGILSTDPELMAEVVHQWIRAIGGVNEDLGKDSTSGERAMEASLPMDEL
jgi:hypothetical protein